jgi:hypothetical protein
MLRQFLAVACLLALGCAARNPALTATPTTEELPTIADPGDATPIEVAIADPLPSPPRMVPEFRLPPLTPEEQAALGETKSHRKFLAFNTFPSFPPGVGTWFGDIRTAVSGRGGPATHVGNAVSVTGVNGTGGAATAHDPVAAQVSGVNGARPAAGRTGPDGGVVTETDPVAKRISDRR